MPMLVKKSPTPPTKLTSPRLSRPTSNMPTFAAAPISPARKARERSGQISVTSATPSAHSPPMPSEAMNRSTAMCQAALANPHMPVKIAYVAIDSAIARTRPIRSPSQPKSTPAGRRADEEHRHDHAEPFALERGVGGELAGQQLVEGRRAHDREHAHLESVEQPSQQRGDKGQPFAAVAGDGATGHANS